MPMAITFRSCCRWTRRCTGPIWNPEFFGTAIYIINEGPDEP